MNRVLYVVFVTCNVTWYVTCYVTCYVIWCLWSTSMGSWFWATLACLYCMMNKMCIYNLKFVSCYKLEYWNWPSRRSRRFIFNEFYPFWCTLFVCFKFKFPTIFLYLFLNVASLIYCKIINKMSSWWIWLDYDNYNAFAFSYCAQYLNTHSCSVHQWIEIMILSFRNSLIWIDSVIFLGVLIMGLINVQIS